MSGSALDRSERRRAVNVFADRCHRGSRRGTRALDGLQHGLFRLLADGIDRALRNAALDEVPLQPLDRVFLAHRRELFLRAVVLRVAHEMPGHAIGHALQKIRTLAQPEPRDPSPAASWT